MSLPLVELCIYLLSLLSLFWTFLCDLTAQAVYLATTAVLPIQNLVFDLERGAGDSHQHCSPQTRCSANIVAVFDKTLTIVRAILGRARRDDIQDIEKGSAISRQLFRHRLSEYLRLVRGNKGPGASAPLSLHISSVPNHTPTPVMPNGLVKSAPSPCDASTIQPPTPPLSPCSSDGSLLESEPSMPNTPTVAEELALAFPDSYLMSPPSLDEGTMYMNGEAFRPFRSLSFKAHGFDEKHNTSRELREMHEPWLGNTGFGFPADTGSRQKMHGFCSLSSRVPFEEGEEMQHIPDVSLSKRGSDRSRHDAAPTPTFVTSDSPWDDGTNEKVGLKGIASWMCAIRAVGDFDSEDYLPCDSGFQPLMI